MEFPWKHLTDYLPHLFLSIWCSLDAGLDEVQGKKKKDEGQGNGWRLMPPWWSYPDQNSRGRYAH